jgi:rare lipoprotein A
MASYYGPGLHGRPTANGETFDKNGFTAAHRKLAFGTCVEVQNLANNRTVKVRVNDRGPYVDGRIIDVSEAAARALGMLDTGVAKVRLSRCD